MCDKGYNFLVCIQCIFFLLDRESSADFLSSNFTSERTLPPEYLDNLSRIGRDLNCHIYFH